MNNDPSVRLHFRVGNIECCPVNVHPKANMSCDVKKIWSYMKPPPAYQIANKNGVVVALCSGSEHSSVNFVLRRKTLLRIYFFAPHTWFINDPLQVMTILPRYSCFIFYHCLILSHCEEKKTNGFLCFFTPESTLYIFRRIYIFARFPILYHGSSQLCCSRVIWWTVARPYFPPIHCTLWFLMHGAYALCFLGVWFIASQYKCYVLSPLLSK